MSRPEQHKATPRRKLSMHQIVEILERNVSLYKEEEHFVHYLVELALYLLEFEYDWSESGVPPENLCVNPDSPLPIRHQANEDEISKVIQSKISPGVTNKSQQKACPYCGENVGEMLVCPACRNLTR